jgi:hypothetical protein
MPLNQQDLATIADTQKKKPEVAVTNRANAGTIFLPVMFKSTHRSCLPSLLILLQYLIEGRHQDQSKSRFPSTTVKRLEIQRITPQQIQVNLKLSCGIVHGSFCSNIEWVGLT